MSMKYIEVICMCLYIPRAKSFHYLTVSRIPPGQCAGDGGSCGCMDGLLVAPLVAGHARLLVMPLVAGVYDSRRNL